jgi:hypothetical protein
MAMERAILINQLPQLKGLKVNFDRLYFGQEFCERLLPTPAQLQEVMEWVKARNLAFTLITPYVTEQGLKQVKDLLETLACQAPQAEVTVNDWGILYLLKEGSYPFPLNLGRLLVKQKRGPQILSVRGKVPAAMWDHFQRANVDLPLTIKFLSPFNIKRVELDNLLQGLKREGEVLPASLYYPYAYITTTRICLTNSCEERTRHMRAIFPCKFECRKYSFTLSHSSMPVKLLLKGNSIFFHKEELPENLESLKIDRLVQEPELPL